MAEILMAELPGAKKKSVESTSPAMSLSAGLPTAYNKVDLGRLSEELS
jgi:hypothetical protein